MSTNSNDNDYYTQDDIVKLMLENLIATFSLREVGDNILLLGKKREEDIMLKDKIPLNSFDILSIIYKTVGCNKLLKCFLDVKVKMPKRKKKIFKKKKKEKLLQSPEDRQKDIVKGKNKEKENDIKNIHEKDKDIENGKIEELKENDYTLYLQSNNSNNNKIEINNDKIMDDLVIEIDKGKESNDDNNKNEEIRLEESDSSSSDIKEINNCRNSEIKIPKSKNKLNLNNENEKITQKEGIKSETKIFNSMKKFRKEKLYDVSFHYYIHNEFFYKFRLDKIDKIKNIARFFCDDTNCRATAEYNLINKIFTIKTSHSIPYNDHNYIKNFKSKDESVLNFMKKNNIYDLQMKKM